MVFLETKFAKTVRAKTVELEKTTQEMLAEAMNAALVSHGRKAVFHVGHERFRVRKNSVAAPRKADRTSLGRSGRTSISGWFDAENLDYAASVACELGVTLQQLANAGLRLVMRRLKK